MLARNKAADNDPLVSRSAADSAVRDALRLFVGRGRRYSVKQLSNASGVADRAIECAMERIDSTDFRPLSFERLLSIASVIGPEFTTEWLKLSQQGSFWLPETDDLPPGELAADVTEDAAHIARRAADGELCENDRHELRPVGRRMMANGARLALAESRRPSHLASVA
jgi:hypothetical protein